MVAMSSAEHVDRAINDPAEWGTPQRGRKSEKRQRGAVISVRMTEAELQAVQEKAARSGQTVGTFMRQSALRSDAAIDGVRVQVAQSVTPARNESPFIDVVADYILRLPLAAGGQNRTLTA